MPMNPTDKDARIFEFQRAIAAEYLKAREKFPAFHSGHEGHAVLMEELEEIWAHVKANTAHHGACKKECVQLAAMAMAFALEVNE